MYLVSEVSSESEMSKQHHYNSESKKREKLLPVIPAYIEATGNKKNPKNIKKAAPAAVPIYIRNNVKYMKERYVSPLHIPTINILEEK